MIQIEKYRIRGSGIQPKSSGCPSGAPHMYYFQSFGAERTIVDVYEAKTILLKSEDFQGVKYGDEESPIFRNSTFVRASYSGRPLRNTDGTLVFTAQEEHIMEFVDEDEVPGWSD